MILRCASNTLVANNTFAGLQLFGFDISDSSGVRGGSVDGLRIVNNIVTVTSGKIYGIESALPGSVSIDNNVAWSGSSGYFATILGVGQLTLADFQAASGFDAHSADADPLFVAPATHDFRLSPSSPAIDRGVVVESVTDRFNGRAPDCGYIEASAQ